MGLSGVEGNHLSLGEIRPFLPQESCPAAMISIDLSYDGTVTTIDLPYDGTVTAITFDPPGPPYFLLITQPSSMGGIPGEPGSPIFTLGPIAEPGKPPPPPPAGGPSTYKGGTGQSPPGGVVTD